MVTPEQQKEFIEAAKTLMDYLNRWHHPRVSVIVDSHRAELVEGLMATVDKTEEFFKNGD